MSDLTKLTAKELRSRFVRLPHDWSLGGQSSMQAPTEEWDEIWLRVDRLEKCEVALELEIVERDKIIGLFSEWDYGQTDSEGPYEHAKRCVSNMMKRLKQCEAALRMYQVDHNREAVGIWPSCRCVICDAARAAVEAK